MSEIGHLLSTFRSTIYEKYPRGCVLTEDDKVLLTGLANNDALIAQATTGLEVIAELLRIAQDSKEKSEVDFNDLSWLLLALSDIIRESDMIRSDAEYALQEQQTRGAIDGVTKLRSRN